MAPFTTQRRPTLFQERSRRRPLMVCRTTTALILTAIVALIGCGTEPEPAVAEPTVNQHLNVSFNALPSRFEVGDNTPEVLRLRPTETVEGQKGPDEMWLEVSDNSDYGIQLEDIVSSQRAIFEALPEGSFGGNQKLQTPAGQAFYSRGRYEFKGAQVEETRVFQVHPSENRLVTFHYRYPAGEDSADRVNELFVWLGELNAAGHPQTAIESQVAD